MLPFFRSLRRRLLDERFVMHRYKSTSHASIAAALVMGGWYLYERYFNDVIRWDFLIIMGIMVLVKTAFLIWYGVRD